MELEGQSTQVESTESSAEASGAESTTTQAASTNEVQQAPAYTPNYKFKYLDKEEEFDEWVRPAIKSKEHEEKLRELYTQARGIPHIKSERDKIREEFGSYKKNYEPLINDVMSGAKYFKAGDYEMAFKAWGIPDQVLQKYVLQKLQQEDLPPEQKAAYNNNIELKRQFLQQQEQLQQYQNQIKQSEEYQQNLVRNAMTTQLDQALQGNEVNSVAKLYDQSKGQNAFKTLVIHHAQAHHARTGQDLTPQEAVMSVAKMLNFQGLQTSNPQQQTVASGSKPVIPVVKGGSTGVVSKKVQSIDDIRKLAEAI